MLEDAATNQGAIEIPGFGDRQALFVEAAEFADRVLGRGPLLPDERRAEAVAQGQDLALGLERRTLAIRGGELVDPGAEVSGVAPGGGVAVAVAAELLAE